MHLPLYQIFAILGILVGIGLWWRAARTDSQVLFLYGAGLIGGLLGAKLAYLLAEGWLYIDHPQRMEIWLTGKSVMGALPGGWIGVEIAKKILHYNRITGDRFAITLPLPLMLGRIGCLQAGCCLGIVTPQGLWPAVEVEMAFLALMLLFLLLLRAKNAWPTQHFHIFLIAYGLFRFGHEFLRATPKPFGGISGYQLIALATAFAAAIAFRHRRINPSPSS
jgi:phosphatidylglycerol:prolipoprotein diacylglycerol transferase